MPRNYWSPTTREALHQGLISIDQEDLLKEYRYWRNEDIVLHFKNEDGEEIEVLGAKRGNIPYAKKKRRKYRELQTGMDGLAWDYDVQGARKEVMRKTHLLFITLTFDRSISIQESWRLCTSKGQALNIFSSKLYKILGNKATYKCKEAQKEGYVAPHILCIMDRPVTAFRHNNKWRVQYRDIVDKIKAAWPYGYVDIQACIDGRVESRGVMSYVMKYATKSVDAYTPKSMRIAELTHAWNKIYGTRDVISKQFMQRLNLFHIEPTEEVGPSGWELASIDISPDLVLLAQRTGWGIVRPPDISFAG